VGPGRPARPPGRLAAPSRHSPRRESASRAPTRQSEWARRAPSRPRESPPVGPSRPCVGPSRLRAKRRVGANLSSHWELKKLPLGTYLLTLYLHLTYTHEREMFNLKLRTISAFKICFQLVIFFFFCPSPAGRHGEGRTRGKRRAPALSCRWSCGRCLLVTATRRSLLRISRVPGVL